MTKEEIQQTINAMAGKIAPNLEIDTTTNIISEKEKGASYTTCLPEDLPIETVRNVHQFDRNFSAASVKAIGDIAIKHMAANAGVEKVVGNVRGDGPSHKVNAVVHRERRFTDSLSKEGQSIEILKPGFTRVNITTSAESGSGMSTVIADIAAMAADQLKK